MKYKLSFLRIVIISICISLVFTFTSSPVAAAPNDTPVLPGPPTVMKIGVIYPTSGPQAYWGLEGEHFWRQAEIDVNSLPQAIAQNIQFQLIPADSQSTGTGALLAAQDLVANHGVEAIVGLPTSPELSGAFGFLTTEQIAVISSTSTAATPALMLPDQVFRIMANELYLARNMAELVVYRGFTKVAIIHTTTNWGIDYSNELQNRLLSLGCAVESVAVAPLPPAPGNYGPEVQDLATKVDALGPDTAVVMVVAEGDDLLILDQARNYPNLHVPWFSALAGQELLTGTYAGFALPDASLFAETVDLWSQEYLLPRNGLADALLQNVEKITGAKPFAENVFIYDAVQIMARAILLAGTYDGSAIAAQIPVAAPSYAPATGPIHFDPSGDRDFEDLAYTCMLPTGTPYEYHYRAYYLGSPTGGFFDILPIPEPREIQWVR